MVDIIIARLFLTVLRYRGCYIVRVESFFDSLESIARHLLLLTGPPPICIPHRVDMFMAVHIVTRLTTDYGAKPSLQAGLKLAGHQGIVSPGFHQDAEVQGVQAQVEDGGDPGQHAHHHRKVCQSFLLGRSLKKFVERRNVQRKLE